MKMTDSQTNRKLRSVAVAALLGLCLGLAAPASSLAARETSQQEKYRLAKQQLDKAKVQRSGLKGMPKSKSTETAYLDTIRSYQRVYDLAPFSGLGADALNARAELYHDMGGMFGKGYYEKSVDTYEVLLREYPRSQYRGSALYGMAETLNVHLQRYGEALKLYQKYLQKYPDSKYVSRAKESERAITKRLAARRRPKPARQPSESIATPVSVQRPVPASVRPAADRTEIKDIRYWNTKGYTRVVVDLAGSVEYQGARVTKPDRIFFDLFDTRLSEALRGKEFDVKEGLLNRIRIAENRAGVTRVVLEVNGAKDYSVFTLPNPYRLVVDIRSKPASQQSPATIARNRTSKKPSATTETIPPPPSARLVSACGATYDASQPKPASDGNHTLSRALGLKVNRIVIDPGHGGNDRGTRGRKGLKEKDLVLDVALRLAKRLEKELCAEVVLTRSTDTFIPLEGRTALANQKKADLFISIHANWSSSRRVRGVETYYLNFTTDAGALAVAARENSLSQQSVHDLQDIVKKISRNEKINESRELAAQIQANLSGRLRRYSKYIRNRGVKKAPFVVLIGANMPSVLAEISYISNASDEEHLKGSRGRDRVVEGLFNGISAYLKDINGFMVAQAD